MSSSNPSDPRLLLPEWLRDGEAPATLKAATPTPTILPDPSPTPANTVAVERAQAPVANVIVAPPATPYSDRLSLDTRLDPGQLVSPTDLPGWLGGLEKVTATKAAKSATLPVSARTTPVVEEPEPHEGVDAPQEGVVDIEVNGWIMIAGAVGLLVLLLASIKLYLS